MKMLKINDIVISKKQSRDNIIPYLILEIKDNEAKCKNILDLYNYTIPLDDLELWIEYQCVCNCDKNHNMKTKEIYKENKDKLYKILKTENDYWKYIVVATSYINPINYLDYIEEEIGEYDGRVLFDLTLCNGKNVIRYCDMLYYNGFITNDNSIINGNTIDSYYKEIINNYYKSHLEMLYNGILSEAQVKMLIEELKE